MNPIISCLCVTRNRVKFLKRSIECFLQQDYFPREMVVIFESDDHDTKKYLTEEIMRNKEQFQPGDRCWISIYEVDRSKEAKLGGLRNLAIDQAFGSILCQWDDDDLFASNRISKQYSVFEKNPKLEACTLERGIYHNSIKRIEKLMFSRPEGWEGTIMFKKTADNRYPNLSKGEDTPFLKYFHDQNTLHVIDDPWLWVYEYHGQNTWDATHFTNLESSFFSLESKME